jgi:integrase
VNVALLALRFTETGKALKNDKRIGTTKTGKVRIVFLHAIVLGLLRKWKEESPNSGAASVRKRPSLLAYEDA